MSGTHNIYGLFIGVNRYESEDIRPLAFASADVVAIRDKLSERFGLEANKSIIIADGVASSAKPTRREILRSMNSFASAPMSGTDTFVLVFAGHGFVCSGKTYLAAADSEIASEALLRETAVSLESVREFLAQIPAGQHILILDACRDAPVRGTRSVATQAMPEAMTRDIGTVIRPETSKSPLGTHAKAILCSCWEGQVAHEYSRGSHGWFCHNLLAELDTTSAQDLSLADLHTRVKRRMRETAWRLLPAAKDQSPHLLIEGDVPVLSSFNLSGRFGRPKPDAKSVDGLQSHVPRPGVVSPQAGAMPYGASVEQETHHLEDQLLAGRVRVVLRSLKSKPDLSPRAQLLGCVAALMARPMRKLRNAEANELVEQLIELMTTSERPLATVLLATLSKYYYRPLRRRFPCTVSVDLNSRDVRPLDPRSQQIAVLVPEAKEVLSEQHGAAT